MVVTPGVTTVDKVVFVLVVIGLSPSGLLASTATH